MHDEETAPLRCHMQGVMMDLDGPKAHPAIAADRFVMIAGDENDSRSLAGFSKKLLQHVVVRLQPEGTALQAPEIDDIAHEIDGVRVVVADKVEERFRLASARAEMNIGDEKGP